MFNEIIKKINLNGKDLELTTGKVARQSDAVLVKMGDSVVLCTTVSARQMKEGASFFPLTVHYREMSYSVGKIPGGFFKREGKGSEREVLVSRLIDRPIRPLFHPAFRNETQVICTVLSYDQECNTDILSIIGASAALAISGVPYLEIVAASRVGFIDEKFVLNPSFEALKNSKLDLIVAGTKTSVMMVESEADLLSEEQMLDAVKFGHEAFQPVIKMIEELAKEVGKPKWQVDELFPSSLKDQIASKQQEAIKAAFAIRLKQDRMAALDKISASVTEFYAQEEYAEKYSGLQIYAALDEVKSDTLRDDVLNNSIRIDGRKPEDIRQISCEVSFLPKTHGSSLFTRGETQALVVTTLGTGQDEQIIDSLDGEYKEHFMLNYIFPPYSVGETTPLRAPNRREIGHGKLAWRAINRVLPTKAQFPYTVRVVSEITESNGSSSMATVCGASMALMDAGVPIKSAVAGIAMGLIKKDNNFVVLSDILGDEDYLGDMDFKVAGSKEGVTALQMDIKVLGITFEVMQQALKQAKNGRIHILAQMEKAILNSNKEISKNAPAIISFKVEKDKIREIIGPGGKVIREICETTGAKIDITDDGNVSVSAVGKEKLDAAVAKVKAIAFDPDIGDIFEGPVVKILESGAFVNYLGSRDGFVHISEISEERIPSVSSMLTIGDIVKVKIIGFDKGKVKLSIKAVSKQTSDKSSKSTTNDPAKEKEHNHKKSSSEQSPSDSEGVVERKYFN